jgi:DNA-directed RNA polymerase subunit F
MANDLTEESLAELLAHIRSEPVFQPRQLIVTQEGLEFARQLAKEDPEFARRVREEFPDLADSLLGEK